MPFRHRRRADAALVTAFVGVLGLALAPAPARAAAGADAPTPPAAGADAPTPPALTLETLMAGMAGTPGVRARFREVKELSLLSAPLELRGTLYFVPPDRLCRITTEPTASRLVIDGDRLRFRDAAGADDLDLSGNPIAREFVSNFIVLFNGDLEALRARYTPTLAGDAGAWTLTLRPRRRPLADVVERVTLAGEGRLLVRMELLETDGDRTTTRFEEVAVDHRFAPEELERLFGDSAHASGSP